jgi:hypothetical protein
MEPKTMKEEVEAIDRKVLAYCEAMETALEPAVAHKPEERLLRADQGVYLPPDGMDLARSIHRQVLRAKNLAWAVQRLPLLDLSFMSSMKKVEFEIRRRLSEGETAKVTLAMPIWISASYPSYSGHPVYQDPKSKIYQSLYGLGMDVEIPGELVVANEAAIGNDWIQPQAFVPEVPAALRRRIDPFIHRFDAVVIVAEAEWHSVPGADPLVVGVIHSGRNERHAFLLGEYDPTKLEKYIVAELAVKPKE